VLSKAIYGHPAFWLYGLLRPIGLDGICAQSAAIALGSLTLLTAAASLDSVLVLPGRDVGYLEHPNVLTFYLAQLIVPVAVWRGVMLFLAKRDAIGAVAPGAVPVARDAPILRFARFARLQTPLSKSLMALLVLIGLACFAWNSVQNQLPRVIVAYDFWDSSAHMWSYVTTRFYKFYIFVVLFPGLAHLFVGVIVALLLPILHAHRERRVVVLPFHQDRCGGFGFVASIILSPVVPALLICGAAALAALIVHGKLDLTPLIGLALTVVALATFYAAPTFFLARVISKAKEAKTSELVDAQRRNFADVYSGAVPPNDVEAAYHYLLYFDEVQRRIDRIPNWPHLRLAAASVGASISPALILPLINASLGLARIIQAPAAQ
jgi:hypothetical protein